MNARKLTPFALGAALLLAGCPREDDGHTPARTVTQIASTQIASRTTDAGLPLELNALRISDADTDEVSLPAPVN